MKSVWKQLMVRRRAQGQCGGKGTGGAENQVVDPPISAQSAATYHSCIVPAARSCHTPTHVGLNLKERLGQMCCRLPACPMVLRASTALIVFALSWRLTGGLLAGCLQWSQPLIQKTTLVVWQRAVKLVWKLSASPIFLLATQFGFVLWNCDNAIGFLVTGIGQGKIFKTRQNKTKDKDTSGFTGAEQQHFGLIQCNKIRGFPSLRI